MTVESDIFDALKGLVSNRVYPGIAPTGTTRPYITYQQIGGQSIGFLGREVPSIENGEIQFNVWSNTPAEAKSLIKQVESALITATAFQASSLGASVGDYDEDMLVYGRRQDFSIWSTR